jgi:hypothetical protein
MIQIFMGSEEYCIMPLGQVGFILLSKVGEPFLSFIDVQQQQSGLMASIDTAGHDY